MIGPVLWSLRTTNHNLIGWWFSIFKILELYMESSLLMSHYRVWFFSNLKHLSASPYCFRNWPCPLRQLLGLRYFRAFLWPKKGLIALRNIQNCIIYIYWDLLRKNCSDFVFDAGATPYFLCITFVHIHLRVGSKISTTITRLAKTILHQIN